MDCSVDLEGRRHIVPDEHDPINTSPEPEVTLARLLPLCLVGAGFFGFFALGFHHYVDFHILEEHHQWLIEKVDQYVILSVLAFMALYVALVALSVPGGSLLTITGGFLFGPLVASVYVVVSATAGATIIFLIAKMALGKVLRARAAPLLHKMEASFHKNALKYMLVLRLIPLFPFWLVNLVPAFLGVSLRTFVIGTFFGIIPGTLVYALVGDGVGALIELGQKPDLYTIFAPRILAPIIGLVLLILAPVLYKKFSPGHRAA